MIRPAFFIDELKKNDIGFFTGVPDSLLKDMCAYLSDHVDAGHHIIAANEGGAIGLAAGYHLATGKTAAVYMQNSGEGNAVNPLVSLMDKDVYNIPVLLLIGWRGEPGEHDEPQHIKQGKVTTGLLNVLGISYDVLSKDEEKASVQIRKAIEHMERTREAYALVIQKGTFDACQLHAVQGNGLSLGREEAIRIVAASLGNKDIVVSTTGMISRELFEYRAMSSQGHDRDFLTVGSMGHASQIALGIALEKKDRQVWCFDGDGASIMHMGNMAIVAGQHPENYIHVVFNNGAHDSVGGQPTVGLDINLPQVALALGYKEAWSVANLTSLYEALEKLKLDEKEGPCLLEVKVKKGNRKDLGRPTTTPIQNKQALMKFLQKDE